MKFEIELPQLSFEKQIETVVFKGMEKSIEKYIERMTTKEWMNMKEAQEYIGVSFNTLQKFRQMGLPVFEIDGVKRISKTEIDNFLQKHSY